MSNYNVSTSENEIQIRQIIEDWAAAVRSGDINKILAHHSAVHEHHSVPGE
jgi:ketosteroid isomerase-like protein